MLLTTEDFMAVFASGRDVKGQVVLAYLRHLANANLNSFFGFSFLKLKVGLDDAYLNKLNLTYSIEDEKTYSHFKPITQSMWLNNTGKSVKILSPIEATPTQIAKLFSFAPFTSATLDFCEENSVPLPTIGWLTILYRFPNYYALSNYEQQNLLT